MVETIDWNSFLSRFRWHQGDHLSIIGPTNSGKTTLLLKLLYKRDYVTIIGTKPEDDTLSNFRKVHKEYQITPVWPPAQASYRNILWPKYTQPGDENKQRRAIDYALRSMFTDRGWCVVADEIWYLSNVLKLDGLLQSYYLQGRSIGLTLAGATQRPRGVPLEMYSQATHLFLFRTGDDYDRQRLGEIGMANTRLIRDTLETLPFRTFLYVNAATGEMCISRVQK
jgi:hypothetical protein